MKSNKQIFVAHLEQDEYRDINSDEENAELLREQQFERQIILEKEKYVELNTRIRQIESDVIDVNQIMKELSSMVSQQSEVIGKFTFSKKILQKLSTYNFFVIKFEYVLIPDTIENCIENATGNIEQGASELQKAAQYQNKFRRKLCILVIISLIIVSILIAILVVTLKR